MTTSRRKTEDLQNRLTQISDFRILEGIEVPPSIVPNFLTLSPPVLSLGQGSPTDVIVGTKQSGPRGVESKIEYSGLLMNERGWIDTFIINSIGGLDDADIRDVRENNPDEDGETPFPSLYSGRTLTLSGKIETKTIWKLRDMQQALQQAFNDITQEKPLIFRTNDVNTDMLIYCKKHQKIEMGDQQTTQDHCERAVQISLRASNPRFLSYIEQFVPYNLGLASGAGEVVIFQVDNRGNYQAQPIFNFFGPLDAPAAGARAVKIVNTNNGRTFWLKAGISSTSLVSAGNYLEVDFTGAGTTVSERDSTGALVAVRNKFIDPFSDKILLDPLLDHNPIAMAYYGSGSIPQISIRYRHTWK